MNLTAMPPAYLPSLVYFWNLAQADQIIITDHFQYVKRSGAAVSAPIGQGELLLTIPVLHDDKKLPISAKRIKAASAWRNKHFKSLKHIFNKTPFTEYYLPDLHELLNSGNNLADFYLKWMEYFIRCLHIPAEFRPASQIGHAETNEESIKLWCTKLSCNEYITDEQYYKKGWINSHTLGSQKILKH